MEKQTNATARTEDNPVEKLAQCMLTRENPLLDWSKEISDDELETSVSTLTSALSWARTVGCSVTELVG